MFAYIKWPPNKTMVVLFLFVTHHNHQFPMFASAGLIVCLTWSKRQHSWLIPPNVSRTITSKDPEAIVVEWKQQMLLGSLLIKIWTSFKILNTFLFKSFIKFTHKQCRNTSCNALSTYFWPRVRNKLNYNVTDIAFENANITSNTDGR